MPLGIHQITPNQQMFFDFKLEISVKCKSLVLSEVFYQHLTRVRDEQVLKFLDALVVNGPDDKKEPPDLKFAKPWPKNYRGA